MNANRHRATIAFGDDRADEDLFRALPRSSITVTVGRRLMAADYADHFVDSCRVVRQMLRSIVLESLTLTVAQHPKTEPAA